MGEKNASTEQTIKEAAKKAFLLNGLKGARMQTIADEAGINRAMLHYYFRSKEKLFEVVLEDAIGEMNDRMGTIAGSNSDIFKKIEQFINQFSEQAIKNPEFDLFMMNEFRLKPEYFEKLMQNSKTGKSIRAFITELEKASANKEIVGEPNQIFLTVMSVCIMPFSAMTMMRAIMGKSEAEYKQLLQDRRVILLDFLMKAIKP